ncbi:hypothetical protein M446_6746 [Methylobacterium sp. 4-46]|uniref:hypothetical protein n=1 Tax=unclassified Methylobacterium TaxID=2615210 RepID=UPI000165CD0B|nr:MULTISPECIES: hypothetical protein [Methylobacterium]ACA20993.1 hypothetical protein M446_6746 [Methylobacterium sp. 4-46]WFT80148.1 hypothetical protein QA634_34070 [Methylobacterium nodulans]
MSRRNPRRAYDENGGEIPPPTLADLRAEGDRTAFVHCNATGCGYEATISTDQFPAEMPFPDIALSLRCVRVEGGRRHARRRRDLRSPARAHRLGHDLIRPAAEAVWRYRAGFVAAI